jgi:hypothetical protein
MSKRLIIACTVTCALIASTAAFPTSALAAGRDYVFMNGDVCRARSISYCLSQTGSMGYGTLFQNFSAAGPKWRAGSGNGSTNRCATNAGPIPRGTATILQHQDNRPCCDIQGRAWQLSDMHCIPFDSSSTIRRELFIHTEENANQTQSCGSPYVEARCWDGQVDYLSVGCIKVKPSDIAIVDTKWHNGSDSTPKVSIDP